MCDTTVNCYRLSMSHPLECELLSDGQPSSTDADSSSKEISDKHLLASLRSQIRLSEAFSGVKFDDVSWEITHKGICLIYMYTYNNIIIHRHY